MGSKFSNHVATVMRKAREGVKYSELSAVEKSAADMLLRRRRLESTVLPGGDWLLNAATRNHTY